MSGIKVDETSYGGVADDDDRDLTGSCHLFGVRNGKKTFSFMLEAGMWQGNRSEAPWRNKSLDEIARIAKAIILSHTHIDHIGRLPRLVRMGFRGSVFCTIPTADLMELMLEDSCNIIKNEEEARCRKVAHSNGRKKHNDRHGHGNGKGGFDPLYSFNDVNRSLDRVKNGGYEYEKWIRISDGIFVKFHPASHVLGAAVTEIKIKDRRSGKDFRIGFTGDLGRDDDLLLPPPVVPEGPLDCLFIESTYGGVSHLDRKSEEKIVLDIMTDATKNGKKIIVPAFAMQRTAELIFYFSYLMQATVSPIPIFLDAPLASKLISVFRRYWGTDAFRGLDYLGFNPFDPNENPFLRLVATEKESVALDYFSGAHIILSGSGTAESGRIKRRLFKELSNEKVIVCLPGHMFPNTLGEKLKNGENLVRIYGEEISVKAKVVSLGSFSSHADGPTLVRYAVKSIQGSSGDDGKGKKIVIVHGSRKRAEALRNDLLYALGKEWKGEIIIPRLGETNLLV